MKATFNESGTHKENKTKVLVLQKLGPVWCGGVDRLVIKIDRKQIVPCVSVESSSPRGTGRERLVLSGKSMEALRGIAV